MQVSFSFTIFAFFLSPASLQEAFRARICRLRSRDAVAARRRLLSMHAICGFSWPNGRSSSWYEENFVVPRSRRWGIPWRQVYGLPPRWHCRSFQSFLCCLFQLHLPGECFCRWCRSCRTWNVGRGYYYLHGRIRHSFFVWILEAHWHLVCRLETHAAAVFRIEPTATLTCLSRWKRTTEIRMLLYWCLSLTKLPWWLFQGQDTLLQFLTADTWLPSEDEDPPCMKVSILDLGNKSQVIRLMLYDGGIQPYCNLDFLDQSAEVGPVFERHDNNIEVDHKWLTIRAHRQSFAVGRKSTISIKRSRFVRTSCSYVAGVAKAIAPAVGEDVVACFIVEKAGRCWDWSELYLCVRVRGEDM